MKWIILLLMVGCIGCVSGPAVNILTPNISVDVVRQNETKDNGLTTHPYNIISGKGINPVLKKNLIYKYEYKYGKKSTQTVYSFPLIVVDF